MQMSKVDAQSFQHSVPQSPQMKNWLGVDLLPLPPWGVRGQSNLNWFVFVCWHCAFSRSISRSLFPSRSPAITTVAPLLTFHCVFYVFFFHSSCDSLHLENFLTLWGFFFKYFFFVCRSLRESAVNGSVYYLFVYAVAHFIFATSSEIKMLVFTLCKFFLKNDQKKVKTG